MKKNLKNCIAAAMLFAGTLSAQTQLSRWHITATDEINFIGTTPSLIGSSSTSPSNVEYNNISDNSGNLLFSISGQNVYNASNVLIGTLPNFMSYTEVAVVPNPGNLTNPCQAKYYIIFPHLSSSLVSTMGYAEVDVVAGTLTVINTNIGNLINPVNPMAVSRVNSSGKRYLYFPAGVPNGVVVRDITSTGIAATGTSIYTGSSGAITQCNEMELSDAGDKLAFVNANGATKDIVVVPINPATGQSTGGTPIITNVTGTISGLEFDNTGNKLFFSKSGSGVYVIDLTTASTPVFITGTSAYGSCMLEKSFYGTEIICASSTTIQGINPATLSVPYAALNTWSISYQLPVRSGMVLMPDQIDGENYNSSSSALFPSFTAPASICSGYSITVNGSASYGTVNGNVVSSPNPITSYVWTVVESNAAGTPVSGATEWWSPWGAGAPGSYTLPSYASGGPNIQCGKYYKIKLALQNCVIPWAETSMVIQVNCNPIANAGPDQTICSGSCATLSAGTVVGRNLIYQWQGPSGIVGTGINTTVCPSATSGTTTYTLTVTNTVTGCWTTDAVSVTVINNEPSFSLYINTTNPSYFTVDATVNNTAAYSIPGFYYSLEIQELNGSGNPYYTDGGTNEWWDFYVHKFRGYVSTGTGTFTQVNWWPSTPSAPGQFLYNHTYKIKRTTWNESCPQQTSYITITPVRSMSTGSITMAVIPESGEVPTGMQLMDPTTIEQLAADNVSIYPNPGTGVFTVETDNLTRAVIDVYDAIGKKVKTIEQENSKSVLDLTGFPKGIYIINIISEGRLTSKKIILE